MAGGAAVPQGPCMAASDLYSNANRDRTSGKLDLSLQEFGDYLRCYGNTDLAPNAQYYIGWIHYSQGDYPSALKDFDAVLEKYPDNNNKMPDAFYYKGLTLVKMSQRTAASAEFTELIQRFPSNSLAPQACNQLKRHGQTLPHDDAPRSGNPRRAERLRHHAPSRSRDLRRFRAAHESAAGKSRDDCSAGAGRPRDWPNATGWAASSCGPATSTWRCGRLKGTAVRPGAAAGFPHGSASTAVKLYEVRDLLRRGAVEIEMVIAISKMVSREFPYVQTELLQTAEACHKEGAALKVVLENAYLTDELKIIACRCGGAGGSGYGEDFDGICALRLYHGRRAADAEASSGRNRNRGGRGHRHGGGRTGIASGRMHSHRNQRRGRDSGRVEKAAGGRAGQPAARVISSSKQTATFPHLPEAIRA